MLDISLGFDALIISFDGLNVVTNLETGQTDAVYKHELAEGESIADIIANRMAGGAITDLLIEGLLDDPTAWDNEGSCPYCGY